MVDGNLKEVGNSLQKNDKISAYGKLIKYKKDWAIDVYQIFRQPTEEEIEKLS